MTRRLPSVRLRTYMRTGAGERLVEDRILRPLTPEERRAGKRDELREYITVFGAPGAKRIHGRRWRAPRDEGSDVELNMRFDPEGMPSVEDQTTMYEMMKPHLHRVARDLALSGVISVSDIPDVEQDFFGVCRDSLKNWDPARASLKTYLYERIASAKIDFVRYLKREKRQFVHQHLGIVAKAWGDVDAPAEPSDFARTIVPCVIPDRHALERMLYAWALSDFLEFLDPDERLALDYLLHEHTQEQIAAWMSCTLMQFRRKILQSIQMKAVHCGFEPHNGTMICKG